MAGGAGSSLMRCPCSARGPARLGSVVDAQFGAHGDADSFPRLVRLSTGFRPCFLIEFHGRVTQGVEDHVVRSREAPYLSAGAYSQVLIFLLKHLVLFPGPGVEILVA